MGPSSKLARREAIMNSSLVDGPGLPLLAIRGYLCFRCLEHKEKLLRCKACQRAVYCSKECQALDWRVTHRGICKVLQQVNEIEDMEDAEERTWEVYVESLLAKSHLAKDRARDSKNLDRNKIDEVGQIFAGQPYCTACHLTRYQLACKGATFTSCSTCNTVGTCSRCSPNHSEEECRFYQLAASLEQFRLRRFEKLDTVSVIQPVGEPYTLEEYKPLSSYQDWSDLFSSVPVRAMAQDETMEDPLHQIMATNSSTIPITILAALEAALPDFVDREYLSLDLVGAAGREAQHLMLFEDILHMLPRLKHLHVVLCGPNVSSSPRSDEADREIPLECCPACSAMGRKRSINLYNGTYHDYARRSTYRQPNLAVLFHSGRSQEAEESWAPTTRFLVKSGICTACTTYTKQEATEEVAELDRLKAKFIIRPEENKWRGLAPFPEFLEDKEHSAYYMNNFWYIFKGTKI